MTNPDKKRKTLTLGKRKADTSIHLRGESRGFDANEKPQDQEPPLVGTIDFLLPCRDYVVDFKVADTKRLSITLEYLLRLLKLLGRLTEEELAEFFNYSRKELEFVLSEAKERDYVAWRNGEVELNNVGRALFSSGQNIPFSLELQSFSKRVGFDLLSLGFEHRGHLSYFERSLPELEVMHTSFVEGGSKDIPAVFRKNYFDIMISDSRLERERKGLYSIDKISSGDRFSALVTVNIRLDERGVGQPDYSLAGPRADQDAASRNEIFESVSSFLGRQCRTKRETDQVSLDLFKALIEGALTTPRSQAVGKLQSPKSMAQDLLDAVNSAEGNSAFIGSPFLPEIGTQLIAAIRDGQSKRQCTSNVAWLLPNAPAWGMTANLPSLIEGVFEEFSFLTDDGTIEASQEEQALKSERAASSPALEWFYSGSLERHTEAAFAPYKKVGHELSISNNLVEVLVCSDAAVLIAIHLPPTRGSAMLTPVGVISSSEKVVNLARQYLIQLQAQTAGTP